MLTVVLTLPIIGFLCAITDGGGVERPPPLLPITKIKNVAKRFFYVHIVNLKRLHKFSILEALGLEKATKFYILKTKFSYLNILQQQNPI